MTAIMQGVRVIEVAEHAFVPGASALLADWGAEVIKIEPVERGDAGRGISTVRAGAVNLLFENANRGKRSIGLDLTTDDGCEILSRLVATADVFMTNKLPQVRKKLRIDVDDIRAKNPAIIYVRGGGQGERGPEAERGSYDLLSYWHRSGASSSVAAADGKVPFLPAPGFGDFTGAMFLAGGTMGALFHRERTGESTIVDGSLLAAGMWSMSGAIAAATHDPAWPWPPVSGNPLSAVYATMDGGHIGLCCLQAGHYWPILCKALGEPDLADDTRFTSHPAILANSAAAAESLARLFASGTVADWRARLADFPGQWTIVQTTADLDADPQVAPNGYLQACHTAAGHPFSLVSAPLQFDEQPAPTARAPEFNEHGDTIMAELGYDWDAIVALKLRGALA
jgi:crotonobetainyl-CoA:carnitine CoA-transferase CaiB-like acyl-CoA transferase